MRKKKKVVFFSFCNPLLSDFVKKQNSILMLPYCFPVSIWKKSALKLKNLSSSTCNICFTVKKKKKKKKVKCLRSISRIWNWIIKYFRFEKTFKIKSSHSPNTKSPPLKHVPKCHIHSSLKYPQRWKFHYLRGQTVPVPNHPFRKWIISNIQSKLSPAQLEAHFGNKS